MGRGKGVVIHRLMAPLFPSSFPSRSHLRAPDGSVKSLTLCTGVTYLRNMPAGRRVQFSIRW